MTKGEHETLRTSSVNPDISLMVEDHLCYDHSCTTKTIESFVQR